MATLFYRVGVACQHIYTLGEFTCVFVLFKYNMAARLKAACWC